MTNFTNFAKNWDSASGVGTISSHADWGLGPFRPPRFVVGTIWQNPFWGWDHQPPGWRNPLGFERLGPFFRQMVPTPNWVLPNGPNPKLGFAKWSQPQNGFCQMVPTPNPGNRQILPKIHFLPPGTIFQKNTSGAGPARFENLVPAGGPNFSQPRYTIGQTQTAPPTHLRNHLTATGARRVVF